MLTWKENAKKSEFTAKAPRAIGGSFVVSRFLSAWNIDYRKKRGAIRQPLGFTDSLDAAMAIAEAASVNGKVT